MIDRQDKIPEPLILASNLLKTIPFRRNGRETERDTMVRHAAIVISELFRENYKLKGQK